LDGLLPFSSGFLTQVRDIIQDGVLPYNFEGYVDVQKSSLLLHDHPRVEARPDLDLVGGESMGSSWVEAPGTDLLELEQTHHVVEEDLQEHKVVAICRFHDLDPLDVDLVLGPIVLSIKDWKVGDLTQTVDAGAPVHSELKLFFDRFPGRTKHILAELLGVVREFRLELQGVLVDALNVLLIVADLEVVGEKLECSTGSLGCSGWLLGEESECG